LCLHRNDAGFVLSFLAELHNLDAQSISTAFYREVFGPAASRDPETALVRIRAKKFAEEFAFANWASMTVYMRAPVDMSALPLNGPRVPQAAWDDDTAPVGQDSCGCAETATADLAAATLDPNQIAAAATSASAPPATAAPTAPSAAPPTPQNLWAS